MNRSLSTQLSDGAWNWSNAIFTIMLREVHCRFAGDPLGYAWTFIVPVLWITTLVFFFELLGRAPAIPVDTPSFIATGVVPYVLFRFTITSMTRVVSTHRHLLHFGHVRVSDLIFSAGLLEFLNTLVIIAIVWVILTITFGPTSVHDPLTVIQGVLLTAMFGASFGRLAVISGMIFPTVKRITPVILRPMFWISGIFFAAPQLPDTLQKYLGWNPLLHSIEIVRSGVYLDYTTEFANTSVPLTVSSAFLLFSYLLQGAFKRGHDNMELT